jgi:hypothetical protein
MTWKQLYAACMPRKRDLSSSPSRRLLVSKDGQRKGTMMKTVFGTAIFMLVSSAALAGYDPANFNPSALTAGETLRILDMGGLYPALIIVVPLVALICGTGVLMRFRRKLRSMQLQIDRLCRHVKQLEAAESRRLFRKLNAPPSEVGTAQVLPNECAPNLAPDRPSREPSPVIG